jgi:hypothetical protein
LVGRHGGAAAQLVLEPEPPDHQLGFLNDVPGHLGMAVHPLREDDRHFHDPHALPPEPAVATGGVSQGDVVAGGELAQAESTIAEGFKVNGSRTGIFGKWHNGDDPRTPEFRRAWEEAFKSLPNKKFVGGLGVNAHGFDEAWVYYSGGWHYFKRRIPHQNQKPL